MSEPAGIGKKAKAQALRPNPVLLILVLVLAGLAGATFGFAVFVEYFGRPAREDEFGVKTWLALSAVSCISFIWTGYRVAKGLPPFDLSLPFGVSPSGVFGIPRRVFPWVSAVVAQILGAVISRTIFT